MAALTRFFRGACPGCKDPVIAAMMVRRRNPAIAAVAVLGLAVSAAGGELTGQAPEAWLLTGQDTAHYRLSRDDEVARSGEGSMRLAARGNRRNSQWAVSVQMVDASAYRGKRMRLRGYLRGEDVHSGGLWLRVDGIVDGKYAMLALDNAEDRRVEGTRDWAVQDIVVDIPPESVTILFGAMITGDGTVWVDDMSFDEVPADVDLTSDTERQVTNSPYARPPGVFPFPANLDFETVSSGREY